MKTWKIFKAGSDTIAYVNVNEKDSRILHIMLCS